MKKTGVEWNAVTYGAYNKVRNIHLIGNHFLINISHLGCL
jgi:hypothetical protein